MASLVSGETVVSFAPCPCVLPKKDVVLIILGTHGANRFGNRLFIKLAFCSFYSIDRKEKNYQSCSLNRRCWKGPLPADPQALPLSFSTSLKLGGNKSSKESSS